MNVRMFCEEGVGTPRALLPSLETDLRLTDEMGPWWCTRHNMTHVYIEEYIKQFKVADPIEDFEDRGAIYNMYGIEPYSSLCSEARLTITQEIRNARLVSVSGKPHVEKYVNHRPPNLS